MLKKSDSNVQETFSIETMVDKYVALYEKVLKERGQTAA